MTGSGFDLWWGSSACRAEPGGSWRAGKPEPRGNLRTGVEENLQLNFITSNADLQEPATHQNKVRWGSPSDGRLWRSSQSGSASPARWSCHRLEKQIDTWDSTVRKPRRVFFSLIDVQQSDILFSQKNKKKQDKQDQVPEEMSSC